MKHSIWPALLFIVGSGLTAILLVARQGGFGAGDLLPFALWLVPMAVILALVARLSGQLLLRLPRILGLVLALSAGFLFGLLTSFVPVIFLGPWGLAFSFPLPSAMISGGMAAFASLATGPRRSQGEKYWFDVSLMVAFAVIFALISEPVYDFLTADTQVKVTFIEWQPDSPFSEIEDPRNLLDQAGEQWIQALALNGKLLPRSQHSRGDEPGVHMIVILQSHMVGLVDLPIPEMGSVVYVVEEEGWRMMPEEAPLSERYLRLEMPGSSGSDYVGFRIQHADGSESGGSAFGWSAPGP
jgi:hypothetical protein